MSVLDEYEWDYDTKAKLNSIKHFLASLDYEKAGAALAGIYESNIES